MTVSELVAQELDMSRKQDALVSLAQTLLRYELAQGTRRGVTRFGVRMAVERCALLIDGDSATLENNAVAELCRRYNA